MSEKEPKNPFEDLQKQIQDALRNPNISFSLHKPAAPVQGSEAGEDEEVPESTEDDEVVLKRIREFSLRPREIRDYLNRFVIKQLEAKKVLSVAICDHYNHVRQCIEKPELVNRDFQKQNILLLGPTGVGKTYLMRCIAKLVGVPYIKADATKFSETGYVGYDVEDLVRDLVKAANGNVDLAQYGIIYIDEIDKIASVATSHGRDVSGRGVQINLLKLMEDTEVNLFSPTDIMSQMQAMMELSRGGRPRKKSINTRHILFIVSGAFDKLAEIVKKRIDNSQIGFGSSPSDFDDTKSNFLKFVETADLIKFGFEPEFVGRLPVREICEPLSVDDLANILLSSEGNILEQYRLDFKGYGLDFKIEEDAIREIAQRAHSENTGARGLMTVLERVFRNFKFELPSTAVKSFAVSVDTIKDSDKALGDLLKENEHAQREVLKGDIDAFAKRFQAEHGLALHFEEEACQVLIEQSLESTKTIRALCEEKFCDFEHGLKIIYRNSGEETFTISKAIVDDPDKELSRMVVASFDHRNDEKQEE